jgi:thiamine-phosphate pyrophosphorylase
MKRPPALYAIADAAFGDPVDIARRVFRGGACLVQIRNKQASSGQLLEQAIRIVQEAPPKGLVIVNDRADIAAIAGAAGVHVGQDDLLPSLAREILDSESLVGLSTHGASQVRASVAEPVDYIAVGPVFETSTKKNHASVIGLECLAEICEAVDLPVVAIGGIRLEHLDEVFAAGANSVAVISDLIGHGSIEARTEKYLDKLTEIEGV